MSKETQIIGIDGININATHYAGMTKEVAIKAMKNDGVTDDKDWAGKAWSASRKAVAEATEVSEEDQEKKAKLLEAQHLDAINRSRAASGIVDELPVADPKTLANTSEVAANTTEGRTATKPK